MLLLAAMDATREIWESRLHSPSGRNFLIRRPLMEKLRFSSRMAFIWHRYQAERTAVRIWPITVATAAPNMPQRNPKMKTGSRMMLTTAPASVDTMANPGLPSDRMIGFMAWPNI